MPSFSTKVQIGSLTLKNPVLLASGTCGYGLELAPFYDPALLGAITLKGLTLAPREGNPPPRLVEVTGGVLNAIGLQNMGYEVFVREKLPEIADSGIVAIANISGNSEAEYVELCSKLQELEPIQAVELNVSCPNVKEGGILFGQDVQVMRSLVEACRKVLQKPLIVKLSPNVTDIVPFACAAEEAGADAISLINTLLGMKIDIDSRKPVLANITGGFAGPAIKPVAVRMVHAVYKNVSIPIIGMGGIANWQDAAEFILAGASAVALGTASMVDPDAGLRVVQGLERYMRKVGATSIQELVGSVIIE